MVKDKHPMLTHEDLLNLKPPFNEINLIIREEKNLKIYMNDKQMNVCITPSKSFMLKFLTLIDSVASSNLVKVDYESESSLADKPNYLVLANTNNLSFIMMNAGGSNPILNFKNGYQSGYSPLKRNFFDKTLANDFVSVLVKKLHTKNEKIEVFFNYNLCDISIADNLILTKGQEAITEFTMMDDNQKVIDAINSKKKTKFLVENL